MYNIFILNENAQIASMVFFYKKYKYFSSTDTYITAIFDRPIFKRTAIVHYNQPPQHGSKYAEEIDLKV